MSADTTITTTTTTTTTNIEMITLAEGERSCAVCGVVVEGGPLSATLSRPLMIGQQPHPSETMEAEFTTCPTCQTRQNAAESRARSSRALVRTRGPHGARSALSAAYDVLAAIGSPTPGSDGQAEPDDAEVDAMVRVLAPWASAVRWSAAWAVGQVATGTAAPSPFAGVGANDLANVRRARAKVLAARVARTQPDVRIGPPAGDGCMMCGVDAVVVSASRVAQEGSEFAVQIQVWSWLKAAPSILGGPHSVQPLVGFTCPRCTAAIEESGAIGITAMEISLRNHLEARGKAEEAVKVEVGRTVGMVAWEALRRSDIQHGRPPREPNRQPWDHMVRSTDSDTDTPTSGAHDE